MIRRPWTDSECAELARRYPHENTDDIARDIGRSRQAVYVQAGAMGLKKTRASRAASIERLLEASKHTRFAKGGRTWNKGIKSSTGTHPNCRPTQFASRPPIEAHNYRPIGSLRINADGCLERKVSDDTSLAPARRWVPVHRMIWIAAHGDIPPGHIVVFRPGMFTAELNEITLDRVELITRTELMRRNTRHRLPPEINSLIAVKARLTRIINERSKASEKQN